MISDDAFARLVAEDVKKRTSNEQKDFLREPENRDRWRRTLLALITNLNNQLEELRLAYEKDQERYGNFGSAGATMLVAVEAEVNDRRKKIERFHFYVEQSLVEADRLLALGEAPEEDSLALFLRKAIEAHRDGAARNEFDPHPLDLALWEALNGRWLFDELEA